MKDNVTAKGRRRSRKIGFLQRGREGSLFHSENSEFLRALSVIASLLLSIRRKSDVN
jgi:hypothetical protein